jgi:hypothetical protein
VASDGTSHLTRAPGDKDVHDLIRFPGRRRSGARRLCRRLILVRGDRAPDAGEDYAALAEGFPAPPANAGLLYTDGFGALTEDAFLNDFANGVDPARARVLASHDISEEHHAE